MLDFPFLSFSAKIEIIGINPFVFLPESVLQSLMVQAGTTKGKIRVHMKIEGFAFTQTLVKYSGHWRLYLNTPMRTVAKKEVGDRAKFEIRFNPEKKEHPVSLELKKALEQNKKAKAKFKSLSPSLQNELMRYIFGLKSEQTKIENAERAIQYLLGKGKFLGREIN
ncbi:YdeI/OmpD-associated family protein [Leptospira sp. 201903075]|uniref:YdeI/OmpD-associated family protein n=1 Tax=Leptospira chreensis TaxID=2810035 RepID=UPI001965080F|nr:YdeI/OmpD-associated family protein [Leptospira chreensis]MBM9589920.1 YdeI/OmpD-associated family protein [Leptospira chreensis]